MHLALLNLKYFCEKHNLNKLAMNQIGRKDGLEWAKVRSMIRYVFRNTNIEIIICSKLEYTKEEKLIILKQFHDSKLGGHGGINRTLKKIKRQFNWPNLKQEVKEYIKNCPSCQFQQTKIQINIIGVQWSLLRRVLNHLKKYF